MDIGDLSLRLHYCEVRDRIRTSNRYHGHRDFEWHYVVGGRATFMIDGQALPVRGGDFFYTEPRTRHLMATPSEALVQYVLWSDSCSRPLRRLLRERFPQGDVRRVGDGHRPLFRRMERQLAGADEVTAAAAGHAFLGFLLDLLGSMPAAEDTMPEAVQRICDWVDEHLDRPLPMDELARVAGCDRSHASRLFKRHIGMPPSAWVVDRKMRQAAELLRGHGEVADVAARVGYVDQFHFSRAFKRWSGRSPSDWRAASG